MLDFQTGADVAKAEQEGEVVYYSHDGEAGHRGPARRLPQGLPQDQDQLRAGPDRRALRQDHRRALGRTASASTSSSSPTSRPRSTSRRRAATSCTSPRSTRPTSPPTRARPAGHFTWAGVTFAGIAYNTLQGEARQAPKTWKDIAEPGLQGRRSAPSCRPPACSTCSGTRCGSFMARTSGRSSPSSAPSGFDSRAQLFDRLAKGDDRVCALAEYAGYTLFKEKGAEIDFVAPPDGLPATPALIGVVNKAPHPEAAKLFVDWAISNRGPGGVPDADHPALRLGPDRRAADGDGQEALPTSSCSSPPTGPTSRPATAPSSRSGTR